MTKLSKCCNAILVDFISGGGDQVKGAYKMCNNCKEHYPWYLDHGQKPLFKRDQD